VVLGRGGEVLVASVFLLLLQCFPVSLCTAVVVVDCVGCPDLVDCLVDFLVDLSVLLFQLLTYVLFNCPGIPVCPSSLDRSTTRLRRSDE
jgi:hypothetical protein